MRSLFFIPPTLQDKIEVLSFTTNIKHYNFLAMLKTIRANVLSTELAAQSQITSKVERTEKRRASLGTQTWNRITQK